MFKQTVKIGNFYAIVLALLLVSFIVGCGPVNAADRPEIYLTNWANGKILKPYYQFLSLQPLTISLEDPRGITCGPGGLIYVAETSKGRIIRFDQEGNYKEEVVIDEPGSGFSGNPLNITFGPDGNLYFVTPENGIWTLKDGDPRERPEQLIKGDYLKQ